MQGGNMDGLWEAPPPGLRMLGDMHMARALASGLCSPGPHPSSALDVAQPACPCGGTGRSLPTHGSKGAAARGSLGALNGLAPSTPMGLGADPGSPSPGLRAAGGSSALALSPAGDLLAA